MPLKAAALPLFLGIFEIQIIRQRGTKQMKKKKHKPIQLLLADVGRVINEYEANGFKVDAATAMKAESMKPMLLSNVRLEAKYQLEIGLFLNALVLATKIANGEELQKEFDATCIRINTVVNARDGVW